MVFARAGLPVEMYDVATETLPGAVADVGVQLARLEAQGLLHGRSAREAAALVSAAPSLAALLQGAQYVQECVPESLELKRKVWADIDAALPAPAEGEGGPVLASSTSNLKCSLWSEHLRPQTRQRCLVAHPVNPPHLIPAVELVPAPWTLPAVTARARALLLEVRQAPLVLKQELDGFVVNRLQYALLAEAYRLVESGAVEPADVDLAVSHGLGLRWAFMGPFQTIDLNAPQGVADYHRRYTPAMSAVLQQEVNRSPCLSDAGAAAIDEAMRRQVPLEQLRQRAAWRDACLMRLAQLKHEPLVQAGLLP